MAIEQTVQMVSVVVASASLVIAAINSILASRRAERQRQTEIETRQAQLFMQIYDKWYDPVFTQNATEINQWEWEDYDDCLKKYISNPTVYPTFASVFRFFQGIGVLLNKGLIDKRFVGDMMPGTIINFYQRWQPIILERRRRATNVRRYGEPVQYLYNEIKKYEEQAQSYISTE